MLGLKLNHVSKRGHREPITDAYPGINGQKRLSTFDIKLLDINQYITILYWTWKHHKCPYKFRFIAGASCCYNKQLGIDFSLALKCFDIHFKNQHNVIHKRTGICFYRSVDENSYQFINKISVRKTVRSNKTFHFHTLYTSSALNVI